MSRGFRNGILSLGCFVALTTSAAYADQPNYIRFFTANNSAYVAYLDMNNQSADAAGNRMVNVKIDTISDAFRDWIKQYFPGGENAAFAIDPYSIDCSAKTVAEHSLAYYDANGFPLTSHDYGGQMVTPINGSMQFYLLERVCGGGPPATLPNRK